MNYEVQPCPCLISDFQNVGASSPLPPETGTIQVNNLSTKALQTARIKTATIKPTETKFPNAGRS